MGITRWRCNVYQPRGNECDEDRSPSVCAYDVPCPHHCVGCGGRRPCSMHTPPEARIRIYKGNFGYWVFKIIWPTGPLSTFGAPAESPPPTALYCESWQQAMRLLR